MNVPNAPKRNFFVNVTKQGDRFLYSTSNGIEYGRMNQTLDDFINKIIRRANFHSKNIVGIRFKNKKYVSSTFNKSVNYLIQITYLREILNEPLIEKKYEDNDTVGIYHNICRKIIFPESWSGGKLFEDVKQTAETEQNDYGNDFGDAMERMFQNNDEMNHKM